jgi:uncharacterized Tic20 family protein
MGQPDRRHIQEIQQQFLRFANGLAYMDLSPQFMGQELVDLMRKSMRIDNLMIAVRERSETVSDYLDQQAKGQLAYQANALMSTANRIARFGLMLVVVTLLLTLISTPPLAMVWHTLWSGPGMPAHRAKGLLAYSAVLCAILLTLTSLVIYITRGTRNKEDNHA